MSNKNISLSSLSTLPSKISGFYSNMSKGKKIYSAFWLVTGIFLVTFIAVVSSLTPKIGGKVYNKTNKDGTEASYLVTRKNDIPTDIGINLKPLQDVILYEDALAIKDEVKKEKYKPIDKIWKTDSTGKKYTTLADAISYDATPDANKGTTDEPFKVYDLTKSKENTYPIYEKDKNGKYVKDSNGDFVPVYEKEADGKTNKLDSQGNPIPTVGYIYTWGNGKEKDAQKNGEWSSISPSDEAANAQNSIAGVGVGFAVALMGAVASTVLVSVKEAKIKKAKAGGVK